jgi:phosphoribosylformylglycinamidine synthase
MFGIGAFMIRRIFVEKRSGFDVEAQGLYKELTTNLNLENVAGVRVLNRYDIENISDELYEVAKANIFSEPNLDRIYEEDEIDLPQDLSFGYEYLPGQYDQRADSAVQCIKLLNSDADSGVHYSKIIVLEGELSKKEMETVKSYLINPVDSKEADVDKPKTLEITLREPDKVEIVRGFTRMPEYSLEKYREAMGFAMSLEDLQFVQKHFFEEEKREPSITELKVIDTYWSDHCRHTTFMTQLDNIRFSEGKYADIIRDTFDEYLDLRKTVYGSKEGERDITLMDMATIGAKYLKKQGKLDDLDESDEINACSVKIKADINGKHEDWLLMFKNETHNHPTEIEPFGGAATCLGGAIRDPLSGRVYVYQAMRVTGAGDPRASIEETLTGKLPQFKITKDAARGYSSYGNQIGLATGQVDEIYDQGYLAKRMEVGAVVGAAPASHVIRRAPENGDVILLVGGRTGRDGIGGATGSSKEHDEESVLTAGAEVQKGNPPVERNIQRLFRRKEVATLIKKCNDFGAGGVSVAVGELADSIDVDLDKVPKKYEGLDGTELAISESQERMAVVVAADDVDKFIRYSCEENLETTPVAEVTDTGRFRMFWRGDTILDLRREFLDTNGVQQKRQIEINDEDELGKLYEGCKKAVTAHVEDLNCASKKGLIDCFDSTIGTGTVLMPLGGKYQLTPAPGMASKLPVTSGDTNTASLMAYGFDPKISKLSPYHGAMFAVIDSVTKIVAMGGDYRNVRLSFQEYFEKLGEDPHKWAKPFAALLGALKVQLELEIAAIGGKDSMSGTFKDINVPPSLISFAVTTADAGRIISPEIKQSGSSLVHVYADCDDNQIIDFDQYKKNMEAVAKLIANGKILSANIIGRGGIFISVLKMAVGNKLGASLDHITETELHQPDYGGLILEIDRNEDLEKLLEGIKYGIIGRTTKRAEIAVDITDVDEKPIGMKLGLDLDEIIKKWEEPLESVFPTRVGPLKVEPLEAFEYKGKSKIAPMIKVPKPKVFIPVFPGTNCEVDSRRAFEKAGAEVNLLNLKNLNPHELKESITEMAAKINDSQIIMIPGGFSGGDEPDGSAKFITVVFRNEYIKEAVTDLLEKRDGLMLGICNGFQALIKLGLVPGGKIIEPTEDAPTLTYNEIGRHVSTLVQTKVVSKLSPWFAGTKLGDVHTIPVSHGEGRFVASEAVLDQLIANGQIATRYVNMDGHPTCDIRYNPNGSALAIEGITSPDGRVLGKMGHSERIGTNLYKNIYGERDQKIFESGVAYFE